MAALPVPAMKLLFNATSATLVQELSYRNWKLGSENFPVLEVCNSLSV